MILKDALADQRVYEQEMLQTGGGTSKRKRPEGKNFTYFILSVLSQFKEVFRIRLEKMIIRIQISYTQCYQNLFTFFISDVYLHWLYPDPQNLMNAGQ